MLILACLLDLGMPLTIISKKFNIIYCHQGMSFLANQDIILICLICYLMRLLHTRSVSVSIVFQTENRFLYSCSGLKVRISFSMTVFPQHLLSRIRKSRATFCIPFHVTIWFVYFFLYAKVTLCHSYTVS